MESNRRIAWMGRTGGMLRKGGREGGRLEGIKEDILLLHAHDDLWAESREKWGQRSFAYNVTIRKLQCISY